ncbi:undecaprenyl-diphosphate phosphatase [Clostridium sp. CF012]|uniref:undecaprenyl-diphosphate phosphatase n=1 Tax=Clostridium sp. CF012 TaxID=2843319 RepID=UPI001C0D7EE0|nr:undecaprenyl-diphosphate phosphatase [Clostridium sp. CF012]MBU3145211.1 undecaprenyl-diphosphate phosphatase [Clostridium sp. CF012]
MNILQAIIYGIVQGIGEFLPISSTAHLVLIPWIFGWKDPGVAFDVALHLGTAAAVIMFFWKDWIKLINAGIRKPKSKDGMLFWLLVLATIPGGLFGVLLDKYMVVFRNPALIGVTLIILGAILYYADKNSAEKIKLEDIGLKRSLIVGISQVFAIIPGVSRSGITMSAGRYLGIEREAIAKFTFLLSTPIIIGDALYNATKIGNVAIDKTPFIVAVLTAAIVGFLSIKFLLNYLKTKGFGIFAIYRFVLGAFVLVTYFIRFK